MATARSRQLGNSDTPYGTRITDRTWLLAAEGDARPISRVLRQWVTRSDVRI